MKGGWWEHQAGNQKFASLATRNKGLSHYADESLFVIVKYRVGLVPSVFLNMEMKALEEL